MLLSKERLKTGSGHGLSSIDISRRLIESSSIILIIRDSFSSSTLSGDSGTGVVSTDDVS